MKPILLDLFCGAGGAAVGYHRAGFDVVGVDIKPQPRYPFAFVQMDAIECLERINRNHWFIECATDDRVWFGKDFAAIHASPPCQAFSKARVIHGKTHPDLLTPTRKLLKETGLPWVIENVPGSPMRADVMLCGSMFGLVSENGGLIRHRCFEFAEPRLLLVPPCDHPSKTISVFGHGGHIYYGMEDWRRVMGIDWMTRDELSQAIPPAYTEYIGKQLMGIIEREP